MNRIDHWIIGLAGWAAISGGLAGCAMREALEPLRREAPRTALPVTKITSASVRFCTLDPEKRRSKLKFLFIVDKSTSNAGVNQPPVVIPPTDPYGFRRYTPLLAFLGQEGFVDDEFVSYALINFSDNAESKTPGFESDRQRFRDLVAEEANPDHTDPPRPRDFGWTNYLDALARARQMITEDIEKESQLPEIVASHYVLFFLSDGAPLVLEGMQTKERILDSIGTLMALSQSDPLRVGSIQLHSGYYYIGAGDSVARERMREMADRGNGDFFEFPEGQVIDFARFAIPEENIRHALRDVFVRNVSSTWLGNELLADSDADGLSDREERALGSSPNSPDSDQNGISDGIERLLYGRSCRGVNCEVAQAIRFPRCQSLQDSQGNYRDTDGDGLNDCEEQELLKSRIDDFNSNRDGEPDGLAYLSQLPFISGSASAALDTDLDGITNYSEVKWHTPLFAANTNLIGLKPYSYSLELLESGALRDCYRLEVRNIAWLGEEDRIRVEVVEGTSVVSEQRVLRVAEKPVRGPTVEFLPEDF